MFRRVFAIVAITATVFASVAFVPTKVSAQTVSTFVSSVSVRVDNKTKQQLYDFLTNLQNDALWYPGILSSTLVHTGPHGKLVGSQYHQTAFVTPELTTNTYIDVLAASNNKYFLIKGDGDVADYTALYTFTKASNGAGVWTLNSTYTVPGLTKEQFAGYLQFATGSLITYFGSTGQVTLNYLEEI